MYRHILLPVDLTDRSHSAIDVGADLAALCGAQVSLLHVIEPIADADDGETADFYRDLEGRARERLAEIQSALATRSIVTEATVTIADRAEEIVRFADQSGVDLIVMTSRRLDPSAANTGWPTVSHRVALLSTLPVLLVR